MRSALCELDALVLPSLSTPYWQEQFGRILVEAMACGIPVIGSSSGAIPEVVADAGIIVPENDAGALSSAIERLAISADFRDELSRRGMARVASQYTQTRIASAYSRFLSELCRA
jgi:glycosyltransferase involved in cell wall biosynthesis